MLFTDSALITIISLWLRLSTLFMSNKLSLHKKLTILVSYFPEANTSKEWGPRKQGQYVCTFWFLGRKRVCIVCT